MLSGVQARANTLTTDPDGFRAFWAARRADLADAGPNLAHNALATLQAFKPQLVCIPQNIDGLLTAAGCVDVLELHGNMNRSRCVSCALDLPGEQSECPKCHSLTRPDVLMFGEELPRHILADAEWAAKSSEVCLDSEADAVLMGPAERILPRLASLVEER